MSLLELHSAALLHVCEPVPQQYVILGYAVKTTATCPCSLREACPRGVLAAAIQDAYHATGGLQPDGSWVAGNSGDFPGDNKRAWLHAPGRKGPLAKITWRDDGGPQLVQLRSSKEAAEIAAGWRADGRRYQEDYLCRLALAERLVAAGVPLPYTAGPSGGYLTLPTGKTVSLPGVLRRLGVETSEVRGSHFTLPPDLVAEFAQ